MKLRNWLNNNSSVVIIVAIVLLVLSLASIIYTSQGPSFEPRIIDVYYYDLGSKKLFIDKSDKYPPIAAPSGEKGVRAYVFSCGSCADEKQRFIGYLEMYTPKAKERLENPQPPAAQMDPDVPPPDFDIYNQGRLVRGMDTEEWVTAESEAGFQIIDKISTKCGGMEYPKSCFPGDKE